MSATVITSLNFKSYSELSNIVTLKDEKAYIYIYIYHPSQRIVPIIDFTQSIAIYT